MREEETRELALCSGFDFGVEDHGCPFLWGTFEYTESCVAQGFGYMVDAAFLMRFMGALGVDRLSDVNGKSCWVTHTGDRITKVEPLHRKQGEPFVIKEWSDWLKERGTQPSAYEMRTGRKP